MHTRVLAVATLVLAAAAVGAAVATAPDRPMGEAPASPVADAAPTPEARSPDPATTARPAGPTGKPNGPRAPAFRGDLTAEAIPVLRDAPPLVELDGWLNVGDDVRTLDDVRGPVTVVQFWTFSCSNCEATLPNLRGLRDRHGDALTIVGVHAPEFPFEEDPIAVADAAAALDVTWPIALDTEKRSFHSWQEGRSGFWPRTYVLDADGRIRFDHVGEGRYDELNATVGVLLDAAGGADG